jgi:hypothetical protein
MTERGFRFSSDAQSGPFAQRAQTPDRAGRMAAPPSLGLRAHEDLPAVSGKCLVLITRQHATVTFSRANSHTRNVGNAEASAKGSSKMPAIRSMAEDRGIDHQLR